MKTELAKLGVTASRDGNPRPRWRRWGKEALWLLLFALILSTMLDLAGAARRCRRAARCQC